MPDDDLERRVRKLTVEHAETRWLALRLDDDVKEARDELRAVRSVQTEHTAQLDAVQRRSPSTRPNSTPYRRGSPSTRRSSTRSTASSGR